MIPRAAIVVVLTGCALLTTCAPPEDQETGSITRDDVRSAREDLPANVAAAIDSGNAAYRAEDYENALRHYRAAAEDDEDVAAAWFGIYMAELALGRVDEATRAIERARELAPGASLIHPEPADTSP